MDQPLRDLWEELRAFTLGLGSDVSDFGDRHPVARVWCTEPNKPIRRGEWAEYTR